MIARTCADHACALRNPGGRCHAREIEDRGYTVPERLMLCRIAPLRDVVREAELIARHRFERRWYDRLIVPGIAVGLAAFWWLVVEAFR